MTKNPDIEKLAFAIEAVESAELAARLGAEVAARFGAREETPLSIVARGEGGALIAGLNGVTHWRWLYVRHLWVGESQRGRGLGRRLMAEVEQIARGRACVGVYVDTFDRRVAKFYEGLGFLRTGEIADFPQGGKRIFLSKRLQ
jgi:ribosomal protein S18 acetylase RimI-like enzyme